MFKTNPKTPFTLIYAYKIKKNLITKNRENKLQWWLAENVQRHSEASEIEISSEENLETNLNGCFVGLSLDRVCLPNSEVLHVNNLAIFAIHAPACTTFGRMLRLQMHTHITNYRTQHLKNAHNPLSGMTPQNKPNTAIAISQSYYSPEREKFSDFLDKIAGNMLNIH